MILTKDELLPECGCGRHHELLTDRAVIAPGAADALEDELGRAKLPRRFAVIYDANTYDALEGKRPCAAREAVLDPAGLHADEHGVAAAEALLGDEPLLVAAGSGTVHDITRHIAAKRGLPFISLPTAASVDGFASTVAAMTLGGFKVTTPAVPPRLVLADTEVIAKAPARLTASGFGDVLGKYISLADWDISRLLTGEYHCDGIAGLTRRAVEETVEAAPGIAAGDRLAYGSLMKALVLSGVAMQLAGNSRPASGAEHHVSHIMELGVPWLPPVDALHGEKVGVGTLLCLKTYSRWRVQRPDALIRAVSAWSEPSDDMITAEFGRVASSVMAENKENCLRRVTAQAVRDNWKGICGILRALPAAEQVESLLKSVGGKTMLEELGVDPALEGRILRWSPYVRNRLTFMRLTGTLSAVSRVCCP